MEVFCAWNALFYESKKYLTYLSKYGIVAFRIKLFSMEKFAKNVIAIVGSIILVGIFTFVWVNLPAEMSFADKLFMTVIHTVMIIVGGIFFIKLISDMGKMYKEIKSMED